MRLTKVLALAGLAIAVLCVTEVQATLVQWEIAPSQSSIKLSIPDQKVSIDGTTVTLRLRNANNTPWTTNVAALSGVIQTNYNHLLGSIQFLSSPSGQFVAMNSGNYRPNPAAFNSANTNTANPDGQFENTSTAPAVFGAKVRAGTPVPEAQDLGFLSIFGTSLNLTSGVLPVNPSGQFAASGTSLGMTQGTLAIDGLSAPFVSQAIPDSLGPLPSLFGANTSGATASVTPTLLNPNLFQLQLPFTVPLAWDIGGVPLTATLSGTLVAYSVPEPSSLLLAGGGLVGLGILTARRRRFRLR